MNKQFGALRGSAILIVVVHHSIDLGILGPQDLGYPPFEGWGSFVLAVLSFLGVFAVPTFLFISGCFAAYATRGDPPQLSWKAVWASLRRLLVPYILWSSVFYIVVWLQRDESYTLAEYAKNLLVGYPFHFVPILALNYLLSPFLARALRRRPYLLVGAIAAYQGFLLIVRDPGIVGFSFPNWVNYLVPPVFGNPLAEWGVYFPLGLAYGLHAERMQSWLFQYRKLFLLATVASFLVVIPPLRSVLNWPWMAYVCPVLFLLYAPSIKRNAIPLVRQLEVVGRKSYGLYLVHLIALDLVFLLLQSLVPDLLGWQAILQPLLFLLALGIPLLLMSGLASRPTRSIYRFLFG
ncbi:MAG: hypothetical protein A2Y73_07890 [Chloroflexi bacterium RBG_13_56_8]|nr:MAG: hypothetical protein A2Y73_07890 [Chloroflexi bacterium RBG_13_56_8]